MTSGPQTTSRSGQDDAGTGSSIDDLPLTSFHRRLTFYSAGGPFLDGYVLAMMGIALTQITPAWNLSGAWQGLIGASALIGLFLGGLLGGYITDRVGRQTMYTLDLLLVAACSVGQFFVEGPILLLIARLLLGMAVGADYPIATSLLAEFAPRRKRGSLLGWLTAMWAAGSAAAFVIGEWLIHLVGDEAWRWMLLSPAIPAVALVFARWGTPESPRWLASQGRIDEANAALQKVFGPTAKLDDIPDDEAKPATLGSLMRGVYLRRMIFISVFWTCSILPIYAIYAFGPAMIDAFGLGEPGQANLGEAGIGLLFLLGCLAATLLANRLNRRTLLIWPFAISTVALLGLGLAGTASTLTIAVLFSVYAVAIGGPTILQWVYPNELFPTEIRATAVGLGTSISRIGAALGTFLTPIGLQTFGIGTTLLIAAAISATGVIVSYFMAPETRNKSLSETSGG